MGERMGFDTTDSHFREGSLRLSGCWTRHSACSNDSQTDGTSGTAGRLHHAIIRSEIDIRLRNLMETSYERMADLLPRLFTPLPGPKAHAVVDRDRQVISSSYTRSQPVVVARAEGAI